MYNKSLPKGWETGTEHDGIIKDISENGSPISLKVRFRVVGLWLDHYKDVKKHSRYIYNGIALAIDYLNFKDPKIQPKTKSMKWNSFQRNGKVRELEHWSRLGIYF